MEVWVLNRAVRLGVQSLGLLLSHNGGPNGKKLEHEMETVTLRGLYEASCLTCVLLGFRMPATRVVDAGNFAPPYVASVMVATEL